MLSAIPALLVKDFGARRAELWLWNEEEGSASLSASAGGKGSSKLEKARPGKGPIGKVLQTRKDLENATMGGKSPAKEMVSAYPLLAREELRGVLALYSAKAAEEDQLKWWRMCAQVTGAAVHAGLSGREDRKTITQLSLLFEATRLLNSTLDLAELLDLILKIARTEVKADRGTVFLVDRKRKELWSIVASGLDRQEIRVPFGRGVAGHVAQSGKVVNVEDAYRLKYHDPSFDRKFQYKTRSLLCLPIRHHTGEIVGVIQLLNKSKGRFTAQDEDFLTKLSGHMAMALENARLHREALEKQRLERELVLARNIQRGLLPDSPPVVPGYELAVLNEPCYEVGGDYYDFLHLGPQSLLLVVADVEGKGVSSAMVMSNLQATLRALVMHLHSLEVLALSLNEMIHHDTKSKKFLSIFLGLVDTRRNGLHYINAGHVPPLLVRGSSGEHQKLEEGGIVVGLFPEAEYSRGSVQLEPGDVLVLCTDGIEEADNARGEEYGSGRLAAAVARQRQKPAQGIVDAVLEEVADFSRDGTHVDDRVLMIMKITKEGLITGAGTPGLRTPTW